jgi:hypothetical protein
VKVIAGSQRTKVIKDRTIANKLGCSIETVRRSRRLCRAAGIDVRPIVCDDFPHLVGAEYTGSRWLLDRRTVPCLQAAVAATPIRGGVVTVDHTISLPARENAPDFVREPLESGAGGGVPPPDVPAQAGMGGSSDVGGAWVGPPLARPSGKAPGRRRARDLAPGDVLEERRLLLELVRERWRVGQEWGLAAALSAAESLALARGGDGHRVAVARRALAAELLGEQLRLEALPRPSDKPNGNSADVSGEGAPQAEGGL